MVNSTKFKEVIPTVYSCLLKIKAEGILTNSFYKANITLVPKPKTLQERTLQTNISYEHKYEAARKILTN